MGLIPGPGRSHMSQSNHACVAQSLSLCSRAGDSSKLIETKNRGPWSPRCISCGSEAQVRNWCLTWVNTHSLIKLRTPRRPHEVAFFPVTRQPPQSLTHRCARECGWKHTLKPQAHPSTPSGLGHLLTWTDWPSVWKADQPCDSYGCPQLRKAHGGCSRDGQQLLAHEASLPQCGLAPVAATTRVAVYINMRQTRLTPQPHPGPSQ